MYYGKSNKIGNYAYLPANYASNYAYLPVIMQICQ